MILTSIFSFSFLLLLIRRFLDQSNRIICEDDMWKKSLLSFYKAGKKKSPFSCPFFLGIYSTSFSPVLQPRLLSPVVPPSSEADGAAADALLFLHLSSPPSPPISTIAGGVPFVPPLHRFLNTFISFLPLCFFSLFMFPPLPTLYVSRKGCCQHPASKGDHKNPPPRDLGAVIRRLMYRSK